MARETENQLWNESAGATFDGRRPTTMATNDNRHVEMSAVEAAVGRRLSNVGHRFSGESEAGKPPALQHPNP